MKRRRGRLMVRIGLLAALALLAAAALDQRMIVREYEIASEKITEPVRLALVADYHGCDYGPDAQDIVKAIVAAAPDVILLAGDIFDDEMPWDASEALVRSLAQRWPCYYVTGNHEYWSGRVDEICRILSDAGLTVLNMDCRTLEVRGQRISVCGIPDPYAMVYSGAPDTQAQLTQTLAGAEAGTFRLLLAHRPELIDRYATAGFDLVVSGHAHGGQVRIPGLLNGLYAPNQGLFPPYAGGVYRAAGTTMVVSRGLARESTRVPRVFNRPELVIIDLK
ncbi:MAG: metallophosphoesterase [Aristaeellaceae bacterium]